MRNREVAKDITQDTFIKTWKYLSAGKEVENIRPFLYTVAKNLITDHFRKKKEWSLDALQESGVTLAVQDNTTHDFIAVADVMRVLEQLEPNYREAVTLRYVNELSPQEIAQITGESVNVVSVHIHRGVKKIREILGENND